MTMNARSLASIRIDADLGGGSKLYLFVRESRSEWDPWWQELFGFLAALAPPTLEWKLEPAQGVLCARRELSESDTERLAAVLRAAPSKEIESHRTLKKTIELLSGPGSRAGIAYFREPDERS